MIIDCVADLHGYYPELEGGDLLIVAGDLMEKDKPHEVIKFALWVNEQNYKRKIVIAGNHDNTIQKNPTIYGELPDSVLTYLCDSGTEFEYEEQVPHPASTEYVSIDVLTYKKRTLKIWGSPWTKTFEGMDPHCKAFTVETEEELAEKWRLIPDDVDILVTHGPAYGVLDRNAQGKHCGSYNLTIRIAELEPKLHVFGHIHESYGNRGVDISKKRLSSFLEIVKTISINASHVNERYEPVNKPIRIEL